MRTNKAAGIVRRRRRGGARGQCPHNSNGPSSAIRSSMLINSDYFKNASYLSKAGGGRGGTVDRDVVLARDHESPDEAD